MTKCIFSLNMILNLKQEEFVAEYKSQPGVILSTIKKVIVTPIHNLRSAVIGAFIGILPGAGSPIAAIVSYNEALRWSKDKSQYGKGDIRGVTASEIANLSFNRFNSLNACLKFLSTGS